MAPSASSHTPIPFFCAAALAGGLAVAVAACGSDASSLPGRTVPVAGDVPAAVGPGSELAPDARGSVDAGAPPAGPANEVRWDAGGAASDPGGLPADAASPPTAAGADAASTDTATPDPCAAITCAEGRVCDPETRLCIEPPLACDPVAQDCGAGMRCFLAPPPQAVACVPDGTVPAGSSCGAQGHDDCSAGGVCVSSQTSASMCARICRLAETGSCATGEACFGLEGAHGFGACAPAPAACDVVKQACGAGKKCTLITAGGDTGCVPAGSIPPGSVCGASGTDDCVAGSICLGQPPQSACTPLCVAPQDCAAGTTCHLFEGLQTGHCMAPH